jgi:hypothetical protein
MRDRLCINFDIWAERLFAPQIERYCEILLQRIDPIFEDVDGEQERVAQEFIRAASSWFQDDHAALTEQAYEHARDSAVEFMEMRAVFMAVGVSGLFHLFEKQVYRHVNRELHDWLRAPVNRWQDLERLIPAFDHKLGMDEASTEFIDAFRDNDLRELRLLANAVKHGEDGPSWRELRAMQALVTSPDRLEKDWTVGEFSTLSVNVSVQADDVKRYQAAILRFWKLQGTFWAFRSAFA